MARDGVGEDGLGVAVGNEADVGNGWRVGGWVEEKRVHGGEEVGIIGGWGGDGGEGCNGGEGRMEGGECGDGGGP